jgi:hypothetical protein
MVRVPGGWTPTGAAAAAELDMSVQHSHGTITQGAKQQSLSLHRHEPAYEISHALVQPLSSAANW